MIVEEPLQPQSHKSPAQPPAPVLRRGASAEGGRAEARYVHTPIGTSSPGAWRGGSREGVLLTRKRKQEALKGKIVTSLNACGRDREAKALSTCGRTFRKMRLPCGDCMVTPMPCDHMLCQECARRRAKSLQKRVFDRCRVSKNHFQFLTLTVPNVPQLTNEVVRKLVKDFARLRRTEAWTCKTKSEEFGSPILGGVLAIECTFNSKSCTWHPHIHVLIEGPQKFTKERLQQLKDDWHRITGNAKYLKLQRLYRVSRRGAKVFGKVDRKAIRELVKYVTKAASFVGEPARVDELVGAFKGVRRVQAFGSFLGALKDEEREPGDETESLKCRHCGGEHLWRDCKFEGIANWDEVDRLPDGTWQLKFDFVKFMRESVPGESPPWALTPAPVVSAEQIPIEFPGAMPEKSEQHASLFDAAA